MSCGIAPAPASVATTGEVVADLSARGENLTRMQTGYAGPGGERKVILAYGDAIRELAPGSRTHEFLSKAWPTSLLAASLRSVPTPISFRHGIVMFLHDVGSGRSGPWVS